MIILGGGGHCLSILDTLLGSSWADVEFGIVDAYKPLGSTVLDVPVVGCDDDLPILFANGYHFAMIAVAGENSFPLRKKLYRNLKEIGFQLPVVIDDSAILAYNVVLGDGVFVGKRAVINTSAQVGICAVINTGAIVEHECKIGAFGQIAPGAVLCGGVTVGEGTFIGAGATVKQSIVIGDEVMVGSGSMVTKSLNPHGGGGYICRQSLCSSLVEPCFIQYFSDTPTTFFEKEAV